MRKIIIIYTLFALMMIVACATVGKKFDIEAVRENIIIGKTTKYEVLQICGEPLSKKSGSNLEVWNYSYVAKNVTIIGAITNMLGIGTEWKSHRQVMDIHLKNGIVEDIITDTAEDTKMHY